LNSLRDFIESLDNPALWKELKYDDRKELKRKRGDFEADLNHVAAAMGSTLEDFPVTDLTPATWPVTSQYLRSKGYLPWDRRRPLFTHKLVRKVLIELGYLPWHYADFKASKRNIQTTRSQNGKRVKTLEATLARPETYGARPEDLTPGPWEDIQRAKSWYTRPINKDRVLEPQDLSTWEKNEGHLRRFFGAMRIRGIDTTAATLTMFSNVRYLEDYMDFFAMLHDGELTYTVRDLLVWAANVARHYQANEELAKSIWHVIKQCRKQFKRRKDLEAVVLDISAADLHHVADLLMDHALAYEADHFHQKSSRAIRHPKAMTAYHYGRALVFRLALATLLRRANLFSMVDGTNLRRRGRDLYFSFSKDEMKSDRAHSQQIRDLWGGRKSYDKLLYLLERYQQLRHHLVDRYLTAHPGSAPPKELILTSEGAPYSLGGATALFRSITGQYLGKHAGPHVVRLVIPTALLAKYGGTIFEEVRSLLHHKHASTTNDHYNRAQRLLKRDMAENRDFLRRLVQQGAEDLAATLKLVRSGRKWGVMKRLDAAMSKQVEILGLLEKTGS
jgi:hypothetical protein